VLFAAAFVFLTYYPHGLPLPTTLRAQKSPATITNNLPAETQKALSCQKHPDCLGSRIVTTASLPNSTKFTGCFSRREIGLYGDLAIEATLGITA